MRYVIAALALMGLLTSMSYGENAVTQHIRCPTGEARAFVAIRSDPPYLVGTIPGNFTNSAIFFSRRFNCLGSGIQVRRVDLGLYDVRLPGQHSEAVVATALSSEGVTASARMIADGIVRVALRGPLVGNDVTSRRDVAFSLLIF